MSFEGISYPAWQKIIAEIGHSKIYRPGEKITMTMLFKANLGTYSHILDVVKGLEKSGVLKLEKIGRDIHIDFTDKGIVINMLLISLIAGLKEECLLKVRKKN